MKRILLVDDEPHVLRVMQHALQREGYEVLTARNGVQALKAIGQQQPDAMVADVQMPQMSGDKLCQCITEQYPDRNFLIIIVTSRTEDEYRTWSQQYDKLIFEEKPLSIRVLLHHLDKHFSRQLAS